ncbi:hypothetical protein L345_17736, partial [Ophiophagus hannah]
HRGWGGLQRISPWGLLRLCSVARTQDKESATFGSRAACGSFGSLLQLPELGVWGWEPPQCRASGSRPATSKRGCQFPARGNSGSRSPCVRKMPRMRDAELMGLEFPLLSKARPILRRQLDSHWPRMVSRPVGWTRRPPGRPRSLQMMGRTTPKMLQPHHHNACREEGKGRIRRGEKEGRWEEGREEVNKGREEGEKGRKRGREGIREGERQKEKERKGKRKERREEGRRWEGGKEGMGRRERGRMERRKENGREAGRKGIRSLISHHNNLSARFVRQWWQAFFRFCADNYARALMCLHASTQKAMHAGGPPHPVRMHVQSPAACNPSVHARAIPHVPCITAHVHATPHACAPDTQQSAVGRQRCAHMCSVALLGELSCAARSSSACHFRHACHRFTNTNIRSPGVGFKFFNNRFCGCGHVGQNQHHPHFFAFWASGHPPGGVILLPESFPEAQEGKKWSGGVFSKTARGILAQLIIGTADCWGEKKKYLKAVVANLFGLLCQKFTQEAMHPATPSMHACAIPAPTIPLLALRLTADFWPV